MRDLRARCDWDGAQTHQSLRPYLMEEAHEVDDALRLADDGLLREELGDLLFQVLFHSVIAEERGAFDLHEVAAALIAKMRTRHPHLYGGGEAVPWERQKAKARESLADGLPVDLPALHRAHRLQDRAAGVGFDWDDVRGPLEKVREEVEEVAAELAPGAEGVAPSQDAIEGELGDLLFAVVNLCRKANVHAAVALDRANLKFVRRFTAVERLAAERGVQVGTASLAELDVLWDAVKEAGG
ncbi:MAG: nucleoside triphosphate pyrophosphohydrolase [Gemmatimonadaceae bacterium]|nr:nucleoside triphosphate pyrophosphohydrolase [Gemmatimonadaceae bacterium]